jgi:preprotein translocase subunit Sec63
VVNSTDYNVLYDYVLCTVVWSVIVFRITVVNNFHVLILIVFNLLIILGIDNEYTNYHIHKVNIS